MSEPSRDPERIMPTFEGPVYPPMRNGGNPGGAAGAAKAAGAPKADGASPAAGPKTVFVSEAAAMPDALGRAAPLARLSELIAHRGAQGPLSIALLGGPGSGKTHALRDVVEGASLLATAALSQPGGAFVPRLVAMRVEAADLGDEPEAALAERLHARISREYPHLAQIAAEDAAHAADDPRQIARDLNNSVDDARRRLAAERAARDEAATRQARLMETVLYDTPGAQIDAYARSARGRIEPALRAFGFAGADPVADYKGLVHSLAECGGAGNRFLASLRSLWAYRGQKKLIVLGLLAFVFAWALSALASDRSWLSTFDAGGDSLKSIGAWFSSHLGAFATAAKLADLVGLACFALLLWRAWRFSQPLWRGAKLVDLDVAARKPDLERQIAHHAQRVDALTRESDALAERAADAERRAGGAERLAQAAPAFAREAATRTTQARAYFAALDAIVAGETQKATGAIPSRFVFAIDSLDRLPPGRALATLSAAAAALSRPAYVLITAFDPRHFDGVEGAGVALQRLVQTPFTLGPADAPGWTAFVEQLAGRATPQPRAPRPAAIGSALDLPLTEPETRLLAALAQLAGPSPRGVSRLVNLYRLARHDAPDDLAAVACHVALSIGGTDGEKQAVARALANADDSPFRAPEAGPRVAAGLDAAAAAQGGPITGASARRAAAAARMWSF